MESDGKGEQMRSTMVHYNEDGTFEVINSRVLLMRSASDVLEITFRNCVIRPSFPVEWLPITINTGDAFVMRHGPNEGRPEVIAIKRGEVPKVFEETDSK